MDGSKKKKTPLKAPISLHHAVYMTLNAPLNWALCVSPGQVRAGSLVSLKESSYSVKRQLW